MRAFFDAVKDSSCTVLGKTLKIKKAVTKFNRSRNWALLKAKELIESAPGGTGATAQLGKDRNVKVGNVIAFEQKPHESRGTFLGPFSSLTLPS